MSTTFTHRNIICKGQNYPSTNYKEDKDHTKFPPSSTRSFFKFEPLIADILIRDRHGVVAYEALLVWAVKDVTKRSFKKEGPCKPKLQGTTAGHRMDPQLELQAPA